MMTMHYIRYLAMAEKLAIQIVFDNSQRQKPERAAKRVRDLHSSSIYRFFRYNGSAANAEKLRKTYVGKVTNLPITYFCVIKNRDKTIIL
jgi:hypothetical protein